MLSHETPKLPLKLVAGVFCGMMRERLMNAVLSVNLGLICECSLTISDNGTSFGGTMAAVLID